MGKITGKGITVILYGEVLTGTNSLGEEIYEEVAEEVENVLISPSTSQEILDQMNLYGRKAIYTLAIPKGDTHDWTNKKISFFGKDWHSFGIPLEGIPELIPLKWNKKVMVERYE